MIGRRFRRNITAVRYWVWLKTGWGAPPVYTLPEAPPVAPPNPVRDAETQFAARTGHPVIVSWDDRGWTAETAVEGRAMSVTSGSYRQSLRQLREMLMQDARRPGKEPA